MPVAVSSRGLEAVLVAFPGFAQNANGAIHPRGAHNQMTFVVDGLPISDQLTGAFANSLDVAVVQTAELLTGNIPAEFGSKVSGVAVVNSRSGSGTGRAVHRRGSPPSADSARGQGVGPGGRGTRRIGYFGSVTTMRTDRFLDQVSLDNLHNAGHFARGFGRVESRSTTRQLRMHVMGGGSRFELANLRSQQAAGRTSARPSNDVSVWGSYLRTLDAASTLEAMAGYRTTNAELRPSPGDTPGDRDAGSPAVDLHGERPIHAQRRRATSSRRGRHQRFPVREQFSMAITSPSFNVPGSRLQRSAGAVRFHPRRRSFRVRRCGGRHQPAHSSSRRCRWAPCR